MRRIIPIIMMLAVGVLSATFLVGKVAYADCGGVETNLIQCDENEDPVCHILELIVEIMSIGIGILGVIGIVVSGIQYLTAGGNEEKTRKSKRRLFELVIGLALFAALAAVVNWLNPGGLFCGKDSANSGGDSINISGNQPLGPGESWPEGQ